MRRLVPVLMLLTACASAGEADGPRATVVVRNGYSGAVRAYVVWNEGRRISLGDVASGRTRTFHPIQKGNDVSIGLSLVSTPSPGTTAGPTGFQGGRPADIRSPYLQSEPIALIQGEGIEWEITPTGSLMFRRISLTAEQGPANSSAPSVPSPN